MVRSFIPFLSHVLRLRLTPLPPTDYELGRLYDAMKDYPQAKVQYDIVMSGKNMEIAGKKGNHKVSLQVRPLLSSSFQIDADDVSRRTWPY